MSTDQHEHREDGHRLEDLHQTVTRRLREDGQRYTAQRRALVDVFAATDAPLTLPQLLERAKVAQSSAYRNLGVLERAGVVFRIVTSSDHACWELAEDLTEHHHHLICRSCGDVTDFTMPTEIEQQLGSALADAALDAGFAPSHHRLDLVGRCPQCQ